MHTVTFKLEHRSCLRNNMWHIKDIIWDRISWRNIFSVQIRSAKTFGTRTLGATTFDIWHKHFWCQYFWRKHFWRDKFLRQNLWFKYFFRAGNFWYGLFLTEIFILKKLEEDDIEKTIWQFLVLNILAQKTLWLKSSGTKTACGKVDARMNAHAKNCLKMLAPYVMASKIICANISCAQVKKLHYTLCIPVGLSPQLTTLITYWLANCKERRQFKMQPAKTFDEFSVTRSW